MNKTRKITYLALLSALATALAYAEYALIPPVGIPGLKLGLANAVTLFTLLRFGEPYAAVVSLARVTLVSFFAGYFLGGTFWISLSGAMLSLFVMALVNRAAKKNVAGLSLCGAAAHNMGQLFAAFIIMGTPEVFYYLPALLIFSVPTGYIVGFFTKALLKRVK